MRDSALGWTVWPSGRSDSKHSFVLEDRHGLETRGRVPSVSDPRLVRVGWPSRNLVIRVSDDAYQLRGVGKWWAQRSQFSASFGPIGSAMVRSRRVASSRRKISGGVDLEIHSVVSERTLERIGLQIIDHGEPVHFARPGAAENG